MTYFDRKQNAYVFLYSFTVDGTYIDPCGRSVEACKAVAAAWLAKAILDIREGQFAVRDFVITRHGTGKAGFRGESQEVARGTIKADLTFEWSDSHAIRS